MDATYVIASDKSRNLVRIKMAGFYGQQDVQDFAAAYRDALTGLQAPGHLTITDITDMPIQAQDIIATFATAFAPPEVRSRRIAFICSSSLSRLQAQRLFGRDGVRFFECGDEAEAWIFG